jgi:hypothetical protein
MFNCGWLHPILYGVCALAQGGTRCWWDVTMQPLSLPHLMNKRTWPRIEPSLWRPVRVESQLRDMLSRDVDIRLTCNRQTGKRGTWRWAYSGWEIVPSSNLHPPRSYPSNLPPFPYNVLYFLLRLLSLPSSSLNHVCTAASISSVKCGNKESAGVKCGEETVKLRGKGENQENQ